MKIARKLRYEEANQRELFSRVDELGKWREKGVTGMCFNLTLYLLERYASGCGRVPFLTVCEEVISPDSPKKEAVVRDLNAALEKYVTIYHQGGKQVKDQVSIILRVIAECGYDSRMHMLGAGNRLEKNAAGKAICQFIVENENAGVLVCENKTENKGHTVGFVRNGEDIYYYNSALALDCGLILQEDADVPAEENRFRSDKLGRAKRFKSGCLSAEAYFNELFNINGIEDVTYVGLDLSVH